MLVINVIAVAIGMTMFAMGAYVLNDLEFVFYALVAVIMLRSVASEIAVTRIIKKSITKDFIVELIMTIAFIVAVRYLDLWWACLTYACVLVVYMVVYRKKIASLIHFIGYLLKKKQSQSTNVNAK